MIQKHKKSRMIQDVKFILFIQQSFKVGSVYGNIPFQWYGTVVKNLPANAEDSRDTSSIPGLGRSPGEWNGNSLQYSCLENLMERNLAGYSPWGPKEADKTEQLSMHSQKPTIRGQIIFSIFFRLICFPKKNMPVTY